MEPKLTIEKPVKQKPKLSELTKIEVPGKPIPAENLENDVVEKKRKKPGKRSPKSSSLATSIKQPEKDSVLIITEKPQAAEKIANSLGQARKYVENRVPFYEVSINGENIIVASAVGHLFNLTYASGERGWPVFKMLWEPSFKKASFTKNYYDLLKKLSKRAKSFVVATDYDIEGEVIGWNVLRFIARQQDAKRMKYSTLTKPELLKSYQNALPTLDWGQAYAGETRHRIDWLYGINLSRALMSAIKTSGSFKILSIGRVQGPALKIIVDREREISGFRPVPYWQVIALVKGVELKHSKDIFDKKELDDFKNLKSGSCTTKISEEILHPPHPFDLTSLQRESYNLHGISPSNTLRIAQSLYLSGLISYPRTSSQKIPKEINPKLILENLKKKFPELTKHISRSEPIEGQKSDPAHPSIFPTGEFKKLEGDEKKIYELVVRRFISCFSADAKLDRKRITLNAEEKKFTASGVKIKFPGWLSVYPAKIEESELPTLEGKQKIDEIKFLEKETQPPKRYTPASLVTLLEKKGLGTKTTRSMIVDTLFNRGYLEGKSIQATPLGIRLIEALEKYSPIIIDENLTRDLEKKMEEIQNSKSGFEEKEKAIIESVERLITDISKEFKIHEKNIGVSLQEGTQELREQQNEQNTIAKCPVCNLGQLAIKYSKKTNKYFVACNRYPECTATYNLPPNALIKNTGKLNEDGLPILVAIRKGRRPWEFPFDPHWKEKQNQDKKQS